MPVTKKEASLNKKVAALFGTGKPILPGTKEMSLLIAAASQKNLRKKA